MQFLNDLYLGATLASKEEEIVKKVNNNQLIPNLFFIIMSTNNDNMLEFVPQWEVMQKAYPKEELRIIGFSNGKKEAVSLLQLIIQESMKNTGSADVRMYLEQKWEEQL